MGHAPSTAGQHVTVVYTPDLGRHEHGRVRPFGSTRDALGGAAASAGGGGAAAPRSLPRLPLQRVMSSLAAPLLGVPYRGLFGSVAIRNSQSRRDLEAAFASSYGDLFGSLSPGASASDGAPAVPEEGAEEAELEDEELDPDAPKGDALSGFGDALRLQLFQQRRNALGLRVALGSHGKCIMCKCGGDTVVECAQCGTHCAACDWTVHAHCLDHERVLYSRASELAAAVSASRHGASASALTVPLAVKLGPNERVTVATVFFGAAAAAASASLAGGYNVVSVPLPYPFQTLRCSSGSCSGLLVPDGVPTVGGIFAYTVTGGATVMRHTHARCSKCNREPVKLHPVLHLHADWCVGSTVSPGQLFSVRLLRIFEAARLCKPSMGINTFRDMWIALTRDALASGVPLPPPPRNATLRVVVGESNLTDVLVATEQGVLFSCPSCRTVSRSVACDGNMVCDCHNGARAGSPSYSDATLSTVSGKLFIPREVVLRAEVEHPAQRQRAELVSCGGTSPAGVHLVKSGGKSSTGLIATVCKHLYYSYVSDLALGEKFSQYGVHLWHFKRLLASQRDSRALAETLVDFASGVHDNILAGGAGNVFSSSLKFLESMRLSHVAPVIEPSPSARVHWDEPSEPGDGQPPLLPFRGASELPPSPNVPPFETDLSAFLSQSVRRSSWLWPFSGFFLDSACQFGKYAQRQGLLDGADGLRVLLNTFHAFGHQPPCAPLFSTLFVPAMGAFDGESSERAFARFLLASRTTRVMRPVLRVASLTLDGLFYSAERAMDHAKFLERQCIFDVRRLYHAMVRYEKALTAVTLITGLSPQALHRNVPEYTKGLLERMRKIQDSSSASTLTGLSAIENLQAQLGMRVVQLLSLESLLHAREMRDERFSSHEVMVQALHNFERKFIVHLFPKELSAQKARLARLRAEILNLRTQITAKGAEAVDTVAVVAHMTATYRSNLQLVMTQLQVLVDYHLVSRPRFAATGPFCLNRCTPTHPSPAHVFPHTAPHL